MKTMKTTIMSKIFHEENIAVQTDGFRIPSGEWTPEEEDLLLAPEERQLLRAAAQRGVTAAQAARATEWAAWGQEGYQDIHVVGVAGAVSVRYRSATGKNVWRAYVLPGGEVELQFRCREGGSLEEYLYGRGFRPVEDDGGTPPLCPGNYAGLLARMTGRPSPTWEDVTALLGCLQGEPSPWERHLIAARLGPAPEEGEERGEPAPEEGEERGEPTIVG